MADDTLMMLELLNHFKEWVSEQESLAEQLAPGPDREAALRLNATLRAELERVTAITLDTITSDAVRAAECALCDTEDDTVHVNCGACGSSGSIVDAGGGASCCDECGGSGLLCYTRTSS